MTAGRPTGRTSADSADATEGAASGGPGRADGPAPVAGDGATSPSAIAEATGVGTGARFGRVGAILFWGAFALTPVLFVKWSLEAPYDPPLSDEYRARIGRDLESLAAAAAEFARTHRRFPAKPADVVPAHLPELPADPWGRPYVFRFNGPAQLWIYCTGADGKLARRPTDIAKVLQLDDVLSGR